jgi:hypothetical protein
MSRFPCRTDDFCTIHGVEWMVTKMGNPVPFCEACEGEEEAMPKERAAKKPDEPAAQD